MTLCPTGEALAKAIVTAPAFAVSEVVLYFSWPSGLAASASVCVAPLVAGAAPVVVGVAAVVAGVLAGAAVVELVAARGAPAAGQGQQADEQRRRRDL